MKSLLEKSKVTQARMLQKVNDAFQQREDMRTQMEEANKAKEAVKNFHLSIYLCTLSLDSLTSLSCFFIAY